MGAGAAFSFSPLDCKVPGFCFDLAKAADLYAQLMGVLTGFTFAVLIVLLTTQFPGRDKDLEAAKESSRDAKRRKVPKESLGDVLFIFVVAFMGAVEATFLYGTVAAEQPTVPRILIKNVIALVAGVTVFLLLTYGLVILVRFLRTEHTARIEQLAGTLVPFMILTYTGVVTTYFDSAPARIAFKRGGWTYGVIGLYGFAVLAVLWRWLHGRVVRVLQWLLTRGLACVRPLGRPLGWALRKLPSARKESADSGETSSGAKVPAYVGWTGAAVVLACAFCIALAQLAPPDWRPHQGFGLGVNIFVVVSVVLFVRAIEGERDRDEAKGSA